MNTTAFLIATMVAAAAPADLPLYEQEPFDRITLNAANNGAVLDVEPLDLPGRKLPSSPRPSQKLRVHLLARPGVEYELSWQAIEKVELFEQMVLAEAERLVTAGELEEAYDYFVFLYTNHANLAGLAEAMEAYLYEEAKAAHRAGRFDRALAMLRETARRNPEREGLEKAMGVATARLVDGYVAAQEYAAVRTLIANLAEQFPGHEVAVEWEGKLKAQAETLLGKARTAVAEQRFDEAARLCREVGAIWPQTPGAKALAEEVHRHHPRVVVAVAAIAADAGPASLADWPGRRTARLRLRTLMELVGSGTEGGQYVCPVGLFATEELGQRLRFEIRPAVPWASGPETLTGYDVSRHLLRMAEEGGPNRPIFWADLLAAVSVSEVYQVEIDLRRVHVRPERLLQTVVPPITWPGPPEPPPGNGPYRLANRTEDESVFIANERYFAGETGQPAEIVERLLEPTQAVEELRAGRVDVVDRVAPWMLRELRTEASEQDAAIAVEPYAFPLVHCLVPSPNGGLTARRSFRRALVYGIDRARILSRLLAGEELANSEIADGPFPRGYARDPEVAPRPYDPHLAAALARMARRELAGTATQASERAGDSPERREAEADTAAEHSASTPLVLAYPPSPVAQAACHLIQRHLAIVGIAVTLRPLTTGEVGSAERGRFPEHADLLYVELAAWEPVADASRLFGAGGLCSHGSSYVQIGLRRLADATDWPAAREALNIIHRVVHDEASIVPLWQLPEYFAYRKELEGLGAQPVTLYQHVEQWRPVFRFVSP